MTAKFRYIGTTDDIVECQNCGKTELRNTIVIAVLDADGNTDQIVYYGSSCAARALGVRGGGAAVLKSASAAHARLVEAAHDARNRLDYYRLPHTGRIAGDVILNAVPAYIAANPNGASNAFASVRALARRNQTVIAEAALIGA